MLVLRVLPSEICSWWSAASWWRGVHTHDEIQQWDALVPETAQAGSALRHVK